MAGNLLAKTKKNPAPKKVYEYRYRVGRSTKSGAFNSVSNKAALRYCGFDEKGAPLKGGGLLQHKLPKGAKIVHVGATGKRAKK